ncbi:MAG: UDP-N-acetylmuramoyl-tripeptide--D-alanyl-D-alanine ligase [Candidatus Doudnabacteria bacterium]|nr:UDP-N-acetylmuramoyl-tripeptide--D-alanyl-D-alanine ligase [Candidatus Doudnabacteria bacterium]
MNPIKLPKYQLYLLQLENYELGRYFRLLFKRGLWPKAAQRKELVWTAKAKALMLMAIGLHILIGVGLFFWAADSRPYMYAIAVVVWFFLFTTYYLLFTTALLLLWPFDFIVKQFIIARAKYRVKGLDKLKVIGIAGSYGKTTMKQVLLEVLGAKFNVAATPESVNTPVGIARWVLKKFDGNLEIAIIEMGEHYQGDIKYLCDMLSPDIAVMTGINEAHLERMKKMEIITDTIFEIVSNAKPGAEVVLNGDDKNITNNYKKYVWPDHRIERFKIEDLRFKSFDAEKLLWQAEIEGIGKIEINLLGEYALGDVSAAVIIAKSLGMSGEEIKKGILNIQPVTHRLQPIRSAGNVLVIDDSYNGNPQGAAEAIRVLSRFENRRKVYTTPGLVEMGKAAPDIHREIGKQLASVADVVILIKNSVTPFIEEGILLVSSRPSEARAGIQEIDSRLRGNDKVAKIIWFGTAQEAHAALSTVLKGGDVVLFQNDWGDQYV